MNRVLFTCSNCLHAMVGEEPIRFCAQCRAPVPSESESPMTLNLAGQALEVRRSLSRGDLCNLHHARLADGRAAVVKIARTPAGNQDVAREADCLADLHKADTSSRYGAFLPSVSARFRFTGTNDSIPRTANVLTYDAEIRHPYELYTLEEVKAAYPTGIDARDMAWIWRRLLTILTHVHACRHVHGAVTPSHILIEPRDHKLVLIGWCGATPFGQKPTIRPGRYRNWADWTDGARASVDLTCAARSMLYLLASPDPAISRHLERAGTVQDAARLLEDFDRMIEAMWGPRQFRPFQMPARLNIEGM